MESPRVLVTGATDGIGKQTAFDLAVRGARVIVHGRNHGRVKDAVGELVSRGLRAEQLEGVSADLSNLEEVRRLGDDLANRPAPIDCVVHNAGVFMNERRVTKEGFELTFAVNHLAPFVLTHRLLPALERAPNPRLVIVSSIAHNRGEIDFDDLQMELGFDGYRAYAASKLANVLFAFDLARRLRARRITVNALHPGVIGTKLLREGFASGGDSVEEGARTSVFLATDPSVSEVTGRYFVDCREARASRAANDEALQVRLYNASVELCGTQPL